MSKNFIAILAALSILSMPLHGYAAPGGGDGPSEQAEKNASDNASFKRDQKDKDNKDRKEKKKNKGNSKDKEQKKDKKKKDKSDKTDKSDKSDKKKDQDK